MICCACHHYLLHVGDGVSGVLLYRPVGASDLSSALSLRNRELDLKVDELQEEVVKYKNDIDQFEYVKSDWQMEKEALEEVLLQLREQLREKEMALNIALAQKVGKVRIHLISVRVIQLCL